MAWRDLGQYSQLAGINNGLGTAGHLKFAVDMAGVIFDSAGGDDQFFRDLLVAQAGGDEL